MKFTKQVKKYGTSNVITILQDEMRHIGIETGDIVEIDVTFLKKGEGNGETETT